MPLLVGETSSFWGGGLANVSNRYSSGHWLLPQLGFLASLGYDGMVRQDLVGGQYGLLDVDPSGEGFLVNPDYYTTVLWQRLVGTRSLDTTVVTSEGTGRGYCLCARIGAGSTGQPGDVVVVYANEQDSIQPINVEVDGGNPTPTRMSVYALTPGGSGGLHSQVLELNGKALPVTPPQTMPALEPLQVKPGPLELAPFGYGFIIIHGVQHPACLS